jgi:hypothetical protein
LIIDQSLVKLTTCVSHFFQLCSNLVKYQQTINHKVSYLSCNLASFETLATPGDAYKVE